MKFKTEKKKHIKSFGNDFVEQRYYEAIHDEGIRINFLQVILDSSICA
jgi:hypothetical protein